ncbi:MAG: DUF4417 domain-containing protein [Lachnospiraceae bacterium]|nr:DUF4417 domain-containing protein [Lachnospiraceae bacterium]
MIKGLSEFEKYKVLRPIIGGSNLDEYGFPILDKEELILEDWKDMNAVGIQNVSPKRANKETMVLMFNYDYKLMSLWNNPLKKIGLFTGYYAVATPDYSIYPQMNINDIRHNIYMARWLGRTWQNYGCIVYPTITWCLPDTYDMCFSGYAEGSIVVISTIGCQENQNIFLQGFNEMKRRISPSLIIVYGDMIDGMTGRFVNYRYEDTFQKGYYQMTIPGLTKVFELREVS